MKVRTCVAAKSAIRMACSLVSATLMQPRATLSQAGLNNRPGAPLFKPGLPVAKRVDEALVRREMAVAFLWL